MAKFTDMDEDFMGDFDGDDPNNVKFASKMNVTDDALPTGQGFEPGENLDGAF